MSLNDIPNLYLAIGGAAIVLAIAAWSAIVRRLLSAAISLAGLALLFLLVTEQGPLNPTIAAVLDRFQLDQQQVVGREVRIPMARDGHFWVRAEIAGEQRRMLVDSGATVTAISQRTARNLGEALSIGVAPVVLNTANGATMAQSGTVERLRIGAIEVRNLKVVVAPAIGPVDVLGMNFLSQLEGWRVEGRTMILTPKAAA